MSRHSVSAYVFRSNIVSLMVFLIVYACRRHPPAMYRNGDKLVSVS